MKKNKKPNKSNQVLERKPSSDYENFVKTMSVILANDDKFQFNFNKNNIWIYNKRNKNVFFIFDGLQNEDCIINIDNFKTIQKKTSIAELFSNFPTPLKILLPEKKEEYCFVPSKSTIYDFQNQYPGLAFYMDSNYSGTFDNRPLIELATHDQTTYFIYAQNEILFEYRQGNAKTEQKKL